MAEKQQLARRIEKVNPDGSKTLIDDSGKSSWEVHKQRMLEAKRRQQQQPRLERRIERINPDGSRTLIDDSGKAKKNAPHPKPTEQPKQEKPQEQPKPQSKEPDYMDDPNEPKKNAGQDIFRLAEEANGSYA